jgi:hypothetical protein
MTKTEIWPAWQWTCDTCGKDNFVRAITIDLTIAERQRFADIHGVELDQVEGGHVAHPERVKCQYCESEFETDG